MNFIRFSHMRGYVSPWCLGYFPESVSLSPEVQLCNRCHKACGSCSQHEDFLLSSSKQIQVTIILVVALAFVLPLTGTWGSFCGHQWGSQVLETSCEYEIEGPGKPSHDWHCIIKSPLHLMLFWDFLTYRTQWCLTSVQFSFPFAVSNLGPSVCQASVLPPDLHSQPCTALQIHNSEWSKNIIYLQAQKKEPFKSDIGKS